MTKDEIVALMDGLPGNTEVVWHDQADGALSTFRDIDACIEGLVHLEVIAPAIGQGATFWERPEDAERFRNVKVISDGAVPVIVLG